MISCRHRTRRSTLLLHANLPSICSQICSYDFEYEDDDDAEQGGDVDVENKYYNAKQMKADNPEEAVDEFLGVPALEEEKGDWGFKGLKQAIKLEFKLGRYEKVGAEQPHARSESVLTAFAGRGALYRTSHLCQVSRHAQLLGEVHQQHARLHREECRGRHCQPMHGTILLKDT